MTKRHFEAFARIIAEQADAPEYDPAMRLYAAIVVIRVAQEFNPRFDRERFLKACNLPTE